jgi:dihydrofolate reductase
MSKVVVSQFVTVDGVIEDPGGSEDFERGGWAFKFDRGTDGDKFKFDEAMDAGALLLGRVTYEGFADAWPSRQGEFADKYNNMPKYVVSTTLVEPEWNNTTVIEDDIVEEVSKLKQEPGDYLLVNGSAQLVQLLADHGLVDEYRMMIFPTVLGAGKRLFGDQSDAATLRLVDTKPVGSEGVIVLTYESVESGSRSP